LSKREGVNSVASTATYPTHSDCFSRANRGVRSKAASVGGLLHYMACVQCRRLALFGHGAMSD
jgi:hypothetical protein